MPVALSNLLFHCVIFLIIITLCVFVEHIIEIQFLRCHRTDHSCLFNIQVFRCIYRHWSVHLYLSHWSCSNFKSAPVESGGK